MSDKGETLNLTGVKFKRILPGPAEKVWKHLTETELLPSWFGDNSVIEPRRGGKVSLMDGHIRGVVTQWRPPYKLIYTWNVFEQGAPEDADSDYPESYPTFELEEQGNDVILTFQHFPVPERFMPQTKTGWHTMLDIVEAALRGETPEDRQAYFQKNAELYGVDLDNLER